MAADKGKAARDEHKLSGQVEDNDNISAIQRLKLSHVPSNN